MRLALKITWVAMVSTTVGLGVQGKLRLDRELQLIEANMLGDQRLIGRTLEPVLEASYQTDGLATANSVLEAAASEEEISLGVTSVAKLERDIADDLGTDGLAVRIEAERSGASRLTTYMALRGSTEPLVLKLTQTTTAKQDFVDAALREFLLLLAGLLSVTTVVGALAGYRLVGRRVEKLVDSARAVSGGDFSDPPNDGGWDELGTLSRAMAEMTRQLEDARAAAESAEDYRGRLTQRMRHADRLATLGTLASRFAHEIGTPLNVILARARMIERGEVEGVEARDNAGIIAGQSERIAERVHEVLRFARRKQTNAEQLDLVRLLDDTKTLLQSLARLHSVTLVGPSSEKVLVSGFPLQLQQAVVNITVNAIHAAPEGSNVELAADTVDDDQPPPQAGPGPYARIRIRDHGEGVGSEIRAQVFEPFFTTKPSGLGTGLGLPIAAEIVRDHHGFIRIEDVEPTGTEFQILIPTRRDDG